MVTVASDQAVPQSRKADKYRNLHASASTAFDKWMPIGAYLKFDTYAMPARKMLKLL